MVSACAEAGETAEIGSPSSSPRGRSQTGRSVAPGAQAGGAQRCLAGGSPQPRTVWQTLKRRRACGGEAGPVAEGLRGSGEMLGLAAQAREGRLPGVGLKGRAGEDPRRRWTPPPHTLLGGHRALTSQAPGTSSRSRRTKPQVLRTQQD